MSNKPKIIAVDCDGTLFENKWPDLGEANTVLIEHLIKEQRDGAKIILWTCRCGEMLTNAVLACLEQGLKFDAVNENIPEIIRDFGSDTRKIFANEYIDDRNVHYLNLPFIVEHTGITDEMISKIEKAFRFTLYPWQVNYLQGRAKNFGIHQTERRNGKTFVHILKKLLSNQERTINPMVRSDILRAMDAPDHMGYSIWFRDEMIAINRVLINHGFDTHLTSFDTIGQEIDKGFQRGYDDFAKRVCLIKPLTIDTEDEL